MRTTKKLAVLAVAAGLSCVARAEYYFGTLTNASTGAVAYTTLQPSGSPTVTSNEVVNMIPVVRRASAAGWTYSGMPPAVVVSRGMEFTPNPPSWSIEVTPYAGGMPAHSVILRSPGAETDLVVSFLYSTPAATNTIIATAISSDYYVLGDQGTFPLQPAGDYAESKDVLPLQMAQWFPDGGITEIEQWTPNLNFAFDNASQTATVKPFSNSGSAGEDNSGVAGAVVIPPFVDTNGVRYAVTGIASSTAIQGNNDRLVSVTVPSSVIRVGGGAFAGCVSLVSASIPAITNLEEQTFYNCTRLKTVKLTNCKSIGGNAFGNCYSLAEVSLPGATDLLGSAFQQNTSLKSISIPSVTNIADNVFAGCSQLEEVNFGKSLEVVPTLGSSAFPAVTGQCLAIVPDALYDAWTGTPGWSELTSMGYSFVVHETWEYARKYDVVNAMQPDSYWDYADIPESKILYRGMEFDSSKGVWSIVIRGNAGGMITDYTLSAFGTAADTKVTLTNIAWAVRATLIPYWKYADKYEVKLQPSGNYLTAQETEGLMQNIGMGFVFPAYSQHKYTLSNFSYNYISGILDNEAVTFVLPAAMPNKARQFVLTVYCDSAPSGVLLDFDGSPTLIIPNGQSSDFWALGAGYNVFKFEEIASGKFLVSKTQGN